MRSLLLYMQDHIAFIVRALLNVHPSFFVKVEKIILNIDIDFIKKKSICFCDIFNGQAYIYLAIHFQNDFMMRLMISDCEKEKNIQKKKSK